MILLISTCKEKLHELEFVKPIEDILRNSGINFFTKHYTQINKKDFAKADKIIICGTSLKDDEFLKDIKNFSWILDFNKPLLGICAGMQIIGKIFGGRIKNKTEIGFFYENLYSFLGITEDKTEVWHLHNNYCDFSREFYIWKGNEIAQAVKHKEKEIYACLFHPEVRNKSLITNFCLG